MKIKTTKKQIRNDFATVISIGYCDLQNLLSRKRAFAFSSGVYGWACDYYDLGGVCISTGYGPIGVRPPHDLVQKYENMALDEVRKNHAGIEDKLDGLISEFIQEVRKSVLV